MGGDQVEIVAPQARQVLEDPAGCRADVEGSPWLGFRFSQPLMPAAAGTAEVAELGLAEWPMTAWRWPPAASLTGGLIASGEVATR